MIGENCVGYFELPNECAHKLRSITNSCAGCSLESEYGCYQARSQGWQRGQCHPQFQSFQVNKIFEV